MTKKPAPPKKIRVWKAWSDITLSTKAFLLSILTILIIGVVFLLGLSFYLNEGQLICCKKDLADYQPVTRAPLSLNLEIKSPDDELLVFDKNIIVSLKTTPFATVVITGKDTLGGEANDKGELSKIVTLGEGINELKVTVFDGSGNSKSDQRVIYYSEEKL